MAQIIVTILYYFQLLSTIRKMTCRFWRINNTFARWLGIIAVIPRVILAPLLFLWLPLKISMSVQSVCPTSVHLAAAAHNEILNPIVGTEKKRPVTMPKALGSRHQRVPLSTVARAVKGHSTVSTVS